MNPTRPRPCARLALERLEDRLTPAGVAPWADPRHLTLSFAPDGTPVSGAPSNLNQLFSQFSDAAWKAEILRAFQTWAQYANVTVGVVADYGLAVGTPGLSQGDLRFGDIRVTARPLDAGPSLAQTVLPDAAGGTWSGDIMVNSQAAFSIGNAPGQYDLYSAILQEAGHALGLTNNATDPTSAMWETYSYKTGLSASDVAAIQALYGPRQADAYEGAAGNDTLATAYDLGRSRTPKTVTADITTPKDVDDYMFTTPRAATGVDGLVVRVQTSGLSPAMLRLTVYNAAGAVVGTDTARSPLDGDLAVPVPGVAASTGYYVKVEGATGDVFSIGSYNLVLDYHYAGQATAVPTATGGVTFINHDHHSDDRIKDAVRLTPADGTTSLTYRASIADSTDADFYRVNPPGLAAGATMTVTVSALDVVGLLPQVDVYDRFARPVPAQVVANEGGTFSVQVPNARLGADYYIRVSAFDPFGTRNVGNYALTVDFSGAAPVKFGAAGGGTLADAARAQSQGMTVSQSRLYAFALSADTNGSATAAAVRMTVFDATGHAVFTQVAFAGRPLSTGTVFLGAGDYTVVFNAATKTGAALPDLTYTLAERVLSDPIDAYPIDPGLDPPPVVVIGPPKTPVTILDPISDPYSVF